MTVRRKIIISIVIAMIMEIVVFNRSYWIYNYFKGDKIVNPTISIVSEESLEEISEFEYANSYSKDEASKLIINHSWDNVKNIYIDFNCEKGYWIQPERQNVENISVSIVDEGHEKVLIG